MSDKSLSMIDELRLSGLHENVELTTAHFNLQVEGLIEKAFLDSGMTEQEVADALDITVERAHHLLHSEGDLHMNSFSRLMRVLGYVVKLTPFKEDITDEGKAILSPADFK